MIQTMTVLPTADDGKNGACSHIQMAECALFDDAILSCHEGVQHGLYCSHIAVQALFIR